MRTVTRVADASALFPRPWLRRGQCGVQATWRKGYSAMGLLEAHAGLAGKVAVVVGGAGEIIGRAVTLGLAKAGVSLATCDIYQDAAAAIVPEVEALGVRILSVHADAGDPQALDAFYDAVEAGFGAADIVVNVAAGVKRSLFMN